MNPDDFSWDIENPDSMRVVIRYKGNKVFHFSMYEAIESCPRKKVIAHIKECDRTPWLKNWGADNEIVDILKGKV